LRIQQLRLPPLLRQHAGEPVAQGLLVEPIFSQQGLIAV
jgi:hypothetical protein